MRTVKGGGDGDSSEGNPFKAVGGSAVSGFTGLRRGITAKGGFD